MIVTLFVVLVTISACHAQNCGWLLGQDCTRYTETIECGTDDVTYRNRCEFAKAQCADPTLHVDRMGPCVTTTPYVPTEPPTTASNSFCVGIGAVTCGNEGPQVCASDGHYYRNMCMFFKARCIHTDLSSGGHNCS